MGREKDWGRRTTISVGWETDYFFFFPVRSETFYIPVASWLSPLLADRTTIKSTKQRVTVITSEADDATMVSRKRRSLPLPQWQPEAEDRQRGQARAVEDLKNRVQADLDESTLFENRLRAALIGEPPL